ncbi:hypothetical protein EVAR_99072_1 [Eumeta japonica]|uniref:Uncharacterized protein n=1 Tax=Eumeta variegata TaxID=151549 RepID=A0A4C1TC35_EUMVA|nr:hypothetical protein EVAR_99072_1 [Eumeta japonica]
MSNKQLAGRQHIAKLQLRDAGRERHYISRRTISMTPSLLVGSLVEAVPFCTRLLLFQNLSPGGCQFYERRSLSIVTSRADFVSCVIYHSSSTYYSFRFGENLEHGR